MATRDVKEREERKRAWRDSNPDPLLRRPGDRDSI